MNQTRRPAAQPVTMGAAQPPVTSTDGAEPHSLEHHVESLRQAIRCWQEMDLAAAHLERIRSGEVGFPVLEMIVRGEGNEPLRVRLDTATLTEEERNTLWDVWTSHVTRDYYHNLEVMKHATTRIPVLAAAAP